MSDNNNAKRWTALGLTAATFLAIGAVTYHYVNTDLDSNPLKNFLDFITGRTAAKSDESSSGQEVDGSVSESKGATNVDVMSEDDVVDMLKIICAIQQETKVFLKGLVESIAAEPLSLEEVYHRVKKGTPEDPLSKQGISMDDFDGLLAKYESREDVKELIDTIMGNEIMEEIPNKAKALTVEKIVEIHKYMCSQLRSIVDDAKKLAATSGPFESRYMTMAGQAIVGASVFKLYEMHPVEIEAAMMLNYVTLQYDHEFLKVSVQIQAALGELMEAYM